MKKISLKNLNLKEVEQLSREQLKSVLGGSSGSGIGNGGNCCITQSWSDTGQSHTQCDVDEASAAYACRTRPSEQTSDYSCSYTC